MHRIDEPTAAPGNLFTEGAPSGGTPATRVSDDWLNAVQEELAGYIESRGFGLAKLDNTQLQQAIEGHVRTEVGGGFRNLIINPQFRYWQRVDPAAGGPFALPTTDIDTFAVTLADRWYATAGGSGAATIDRVAFTVGQTDVPFEPVHYLEWDQTTGATTSDPALIQAIEDVRTAAGQTITVQFEARLTSGGTIDVDADVRQYFGAGGSADVIQASSNGPVTIGVAWEKHSVQIAVPSLSGKTIDPQHHYLAVRLRLPQSDTFTIQITNFQVERGAGASDFERRNEADEIRLCQRYYEKNQGNIDLPVSNAGATMTGFTVNYDGSTGFCPIAGLAFQTPKRHYGVPGGGGSFLEFWNAGATGAIDVYAGATFSNNRGCSTVIIDANGATEGTWTLNPPAAQLWLAFAAWEVDVEFGTE